MAGNEQTNARRILALEERLAAVEAALARAGVALLPASAAAAAEQRAAAPPPTTEEAGFVAAPPTAVPGSARPPGVMPVPRSPVRKGGPGEPDRVRAAPAVQSASASAPIAARSLWSWFTDGNTMVRVGIVVLFFGVAFLLSYFAEHVTIPIELQFGGVALAGGALIAVGARLSRSRRNYALALIGGGLGVLYLTTFAALELVPLLAPAAAFALLAAIALLAIVLSVAFDAQALAALAALGGLLAPVLVRTVSEPLPLFGYVAAVNAVVVGVAWFRAWRALDLVGFAGTFVLGLWWGSEYYEPAYFAVVEPFLAGFFLVYVAVPVAHAFRGAGERRIDVALVFGVPIVALALQALLVQGTRYGLAWTTAVVAALYALLWLALRRKEPGMALAAAFGALAVIFATLAVPFALDERWTSAVWAIEAAAIYRIGCREDRRIVRAFALVLQVAAGVAFLLGGFEYRAGAAFVNRRFLGCMAIALAAFASVRLGDRRGETLPAAERSMLHIVFGWGGLWWLGGGMAEITARALIGTETHGMLTWIVGSVALASMLARRLEWLRLNDAAVVLLPAIALALAHDVGQGRTSLTEYGWAVYPLAWTLHFAVLYRSEAQAGSAASVTTKGFELRRWLTAWHAVGALLLLGQLAWEAGHWTARMTARDSVWAACSHIAPLALYLLVLIPAKRRARWPLSSFADAYVVTAGTIVAVALAVGAVALAVLNPGDPWPLPYVPLANPLELTLALSLGALFLWAGRGAGASVEARYRALGIGAFIVLNGIVARTVHHWLDVPWQWPALAASRPLQAALTLTWTVAALAAMVAATRRGFRALWLTGAGLLAAVVIKLFALDLAALSGLTRVVAFLGVGALLLVIGYLAPLPPPAREGANA